MTDSIPEQQWAAPDTTQLGSLRAGWYADPFGRFDSRYHNGAHWTADVAADGRRYVDPEGVGPTGPARRNGLATAALVLGIAAVAVGWLPYLFVVALVAGPLAIVLGAVALRRSRDRGAGRGQSIVGITTGACSILAAALGLLLTVVVTDLLDAYNDPNPNTVEIVRCESDDGVVTAVGRITNRGTDEADFVVRLEFLRAGTANAHRTTAVAVDDVPAGGTRQFEVVRAVDLELVDCAVSEVTGPRPFGIDLG